MKNVRWVVVLLILAMGMAANAENKFTGHANTHLLQFDLSYPALALSMYSPGTFAGGSVLNDWFVPDVYYAHGSKVVTPVFSLSYYYVVKQWLHVGGVFSYAGAYADVRDRPTNAFVAKASVNSFILMPSVNFVYLRRKYVSLYSGLSLGVRLGSVHNYDLLPEVSEPNRWQCMPTAQFTFLGARFGAKVYGVVEIGTGSKTLGVSAGVGCRF